MRGDCKRECRCPQAGAGVLVAYFVNSANGAAKKRENAPDQQGRIIYY
jgi:hypothetical protein